MPEEEEIMRPATLQYPIHVERRGSSGWDMWPQRTVSMWVSNLPHAWISHGPPLSRRGTTTHPLVIVGTLLSRPKSYRRPFKLLFADAVLWILGFLTQNADKMRFRRRKEVFWRLLVMFCYDGKAEYIQYYRCALILMWNLSTSGLKHAFNWRTWQNFSFNLAAIQQKQLKTGIFFKCFLSVCCICLLRTFPAWTQALSVLKGQMGS